MNNSMNSRKNAARKELQQQKLDAGVMTEHFPEVSSIVVSMMYNQRGSRSLSRTINYFPGSYAFFRIDCLNNDCIDGGFDLNQIITSMIKNRREVSKGDLSCESADHSDISYEVAIQYS